LKKKKGKEKKRSEGPTPLISILEQEGEKREKKRGLKREKALADS